MSLRILRLIGALLRNDAAVKNTNDKKLQIRAGLRLFAVLYTILLCALSRNAVFTVTVLAVLLLRLSMLPAPAIRRVVSRTVLPVLFAALICLPAVFLGHPGTMLTVSMKVLESVLLLSLLGEECSWKELTDALAVLHLPDVFILTLDMTVRFLVILGRLSVSLTESVELRSPADTARRWKQALRAAGGILGTTFLLSQRMAQQTSEAMELRGFEGEYRRKRGGRLRFPEGLFLLLFPILMAFFVFCERSAGAG